MHTVSPLAVGFCAVVLAAPAQALVIYENDFQAAVGSEWSKSTIENTPTPYPTGPRSFLGQFGNETVTLTLGGLPAHTAVQLDFDLYLIRSWDGSSGGAPLYDFGNDVFRVAVQGGPLLLAETFSNGNPAGQSYGPNANNPAFTGAAETYSLGYVFNDGTINQVMDSVYRFNFLFSDTRNLVAFDFSAFGLQGLDDESWGLDNVRVSLLGMPTRAVDEPATLALLGIGLLGAGLARRRLRRV
jgi:hypothetical protein